MKIDDRFYMKLALDEAWKYQLLTYPNPAVGCVLVKNNVILSIEAHKKAGDSHAELNALKEAYLKKYPNSVLKILDDPFEINAYLISNHNDFFVDCTVYLTLEPCSHIGKTPSCANLLVKLNVKRVVVGLEDINTQASGGIAIIKKSNIELSINSVLYKECRDLIYPFIKWMQGSFIFYKMAQTLNGVVSGGYISSNQTLCYVHTLRDVIDCLAIGGNTVRIDKPTLDSRHIKGRNPDVFIYSRSKTFDSNIPLFKIDNRKIIISDDLFKLLDYKFIMVEGSYRLLDLLKDKLDYLVLLITPKIKNGINILNNINIDFEIIHENYIGKDKIVYLKKI